MPISVSITVADPPAAPAGYTVVAFEVRRYTAGIVGHGCVAHAGTEEGFLEAVIALVNAAKLSLREVGAGFRLAAVAWWVDSHMHECIDGRERLVSIYDAGAGQWGAWIPEERIGSASGGAHKKHGLSRHQQNVIRKTT